MKIISGDSPVTVSEVARRAGVQSWNKYVDARELPEDDNEFKNLVKDTTVFGRVTPHQKKKNCYSPSRNGSYCCNDW